MDRVTKWGVFLVFLIGVITLNSSDVLSKNVEANQKPQKQEVISPSILGNQPGIKPKPTGSPYREGVIIVRLKEGVNFSLQKSSEKNYAITSNNVQLDNLNKQYIDGAYLVFSHLMRTDAKTGSVTVLSSRSQIEEIKTKFPERSLRIPKNAVAPELNRTLCLVLKKGITTKQALEAYKVLVNDSLEYVQPDLSQQLGLAPNDRYIDPNHDGVWTSPDWDGAMYGEAMHALHRINPEGTWGLGITGSRGDGNQAIIVAVNDGGINYHHNDFDFSADQDNIWKNPGETPYDGMDNDGNGYIDDYHGWDFVGDHTPNQEWEDYSPDTLCHGNPRDPYYSETDFCDEDPIDHWGHGTHIAGIIGAVGDNDFMNSDGTFAPGKGIAGVNFAVKLMAVKTFPDHGDSSYSSFNAQGIIYAADNGADIVNNSWCFALSVGRYPYDGPVVEAVQYAYALGTVSVFMSGTNHTDNHQGGYGDVIWPFGDDVQFYSPQNMTTSKPIVVAGVLDDCIPWGDVTVCRWGDSDFGDEIDVSAPAVDILSLSTAPQSNIGGQGIPNGDDYIRATGVSASPAFVSGLAALLLSVNGDLTNEEIRTLIREGAQDLVGGNNGPGFDIETGAGMINVSNTVTQYVITAAPGPNNPLQAAINTAAANGQRIVLVEPGVYPENIIMKPNVQVRARVKYASIIEPPNPGTTAVSFQLIDDDPWIPITNSSLSGFTIHSPEGNGIYIVFAHNVQVSDNIIENASSGIFLDCFSDNLIIKNNTIRNTHTAIDTQSASEGDHDYSRNMDATVKNNLIYNNTFGAFIRISQGSDFRLVNNVIDDNIQGITTEQILSNSVLTIKNNIITYNGELGINHQAGGNIDGGLTFNNVWHNGDAQHNFEWNCENCTLNADTNLSEDPLFLDPSSRNYHLMSSFGQSSNCINNGDPGHGYDDLDDSRNDIGVFGGPGGEITYSGHYLIVSSDGQGDYATIQEAVSASYPRDIIYVRAGTYEVDEPIVVPDRVSLVGQNPSNTIILSDYHPGYYDYQGVVKFENVSNATLSGFTIRSTPRDDWEEPIQAISVDNSDNVTITRNVIDGGSDWAWDGPLGGIWIGNNSSVTITRNTIKNPAYTHWRGGPGWAAIYAGYQYDGGITEPDVEDPRSNIHLQIDHNIITDYVHSGISVYIDDPDGISSDVSVANNTIYNSQRYGDGFLATGVEAYGNTWGIKIKNNIIARNYMATFGVYVNPDDPTGCPNFLGRVFHNDSWQNDMGIPERCGNINANPLVINAETGDFRLTENSPCIDAGAPNSPPDPDGTVADIGARYYPSPVTRTGREEVYN